MSDRSPRRKENNSPSHPSSLIPHPSSLLNGGIGCLISGLVCLTWMPANAQLIPDNTLGNEPSIVTPDIDINGLPSDQIDGGALREANLFHSFSEFNVGEGRGVYFSNPASVERILTRVTGSNVSQILGTLGVLGNADLFLINPNGITLGPDARLALNGSFIASTANSITFSNGWEFSATNPEAPPLLTVSVPLGLQYITNSGSIVNQSQADDVGLQVQPGRTLALVGGDISLAGGYLTAPEGRIELGSVGNNALVTLNPTAVGWELGYEGVSDFRDISLSQAAFVDTSGEGGGDIQLQGRRVTLTEDAQISSITLGSQPGGTLSVTASESVELSGDLTSLSVATEGSGQGGDLIVVTGRLIARDGGFLLADTEGEGQGGDLTVKASESVELIGVTSDGQFSSGLFAQPFETATGNGGNLTVETGRLIIRDGALIAANTLGDGKAGNITVRASESVELIGVGLNPDLASGIAAGADFGAAGDGGNLTIDTKRLVVQGGSQIQTSIDGAGNAGLLTINASESVQLSGAAPNADLQFGSSGLFASAEEGATGNPGGLIINTGQLIVEDGARISADNFGSGGSDMGENSTIGNLTINVGELTIRNGGTVRAGSFGEGPGGILVVNAVDTVEVTGTGTLGGEAIASSLFTQAQGNGNAGDLTINTGQLRVTNQGNITVGSTSDEGDAGTLTINARSVYLDNQGRLSADNKAGLGNINLNIENSLLLRHNSLISTNSQGNEPGGNITINANNLVALENSDITANAVNSEGGKVTVNLRGGIFGTEFRPQLTPESDITATSDLGAEFNGVVQINTPEVDPSSGLVALAGDLVDVESLVAKDLCAPDVAGSSFVVTGRGGLPPNPNDPLTNEVVAVEWLKPDGTTDLVTDVKDGGGGDRRVIRQAQGWRVAPDGTILLTAEAPRATPYDSGFTHPSCQAN